MQMSCGRKVAGMLKQARKAVWLEVTEKGKR